MNKEEYDSFIDQLLENAVRDFQRTGQYRLLREKLEQMDRDCDTIFQTAEKGFAVECFELIMDMDGQQEQYVYRKAFQDCVSVLKWMGVLA